MRTYPVVRLLLHRLALSFLALAKEIPLLERIVIRGIFKLIGVRCDHATIHKDSGWMHLNNRGTVPISRARMINLRDISSWLAPLKGTSVVHIQLIQPLAVDITTAINEHLGTNGRATLQKARFRGTLLVCSLDLQELPFHQRIIIVRHGPTLNKTMQVRKVLCDEHQVSLWCGGEENTQSQLFRQFCADLKRTVTLLVFAGHFQYTTSGGICV